MKLSSYEGSSRAPGSGGVGAPGIERAELYLLNGANECFGENGFRNADAPSDSIDLELEQFRHNRVRMLPLVSRRAEPDTGRMVRLW